MSPRLRQIAFGCGPSIATTSGPERNEQTTAVALVPRDCRLCRCLRQHRSFEEPSMRALTVRTACALAVLGCAPSSAQHISAGKSAPDETAHIQRIAGNKKRHFACAVAHATKGALETKASTDSIAAAAFRGCRDIELEFKKRLEAGAPTTSGHVAAVGRPVVAQLMQIRRRELQQSIMGAIKDIRPTKR